MQRGGGGLLIPRGGPPRRLDHYPELKRGPSLRIEALAYTMETDRHRRNRPLGRQKCSKMDVLYLLDENVSHLDTSVW